MIIIFLLLIIALLYNINSNEHFSNYIDPSIQIFKKIKTLDNNDKIIYIDDIIPSNLKIKKIKGKGWGLVSNSLIEKGKIITIAPVRYYNKFKPIIKSKIGKKVIERNIHSSKNSINGKYLFDYWNVFLNHDDNENAFYENRFYEKNKEIYTVLKSTKEIKLGDEILINYNNLYK